jgi:hypothetical protein
MAWFLRLCVIVNFDTQKSITNMKKMILVMAFGAIATAVNAQDNKFYLKGGYNLANVSVTSDGNVDDTRVIPSFHAGLMADLPIGAGLLSLQPGILYTGKGSKLEYGGSNQIYQFTVVTNPKYIEVPINLVVNLPLADKESKFFVGAGPYAAMGIAGKSKLDGSIFNTTLKSEDKIEFTGDGENESDPELNVVLGTKYMKRFDYGINGTAGFAFKNILLSINYGHGLSKVREVVGEQNDDRMKHRVWSLSLGVSL